VVTGHDGDGRSVVWIDGDAENTKSFGGVTSTLLWATDGAPAAFLGDDDAGAWDLGTSPLPSGSRFAYITAAPGSGRRALHQTDTLDYVICVAGEITLWLDESSVTLRAGDIAVQRGTNHAWENQGAETAAFVCVLLDAEPKRGGSLSGTQQAS
jgi:mannose-6-phosphate isomerase-like protein (cupin superfamily)